MSHWPAIASPAHSVGIPARVFSRATHAGKWCAIVGLEAFLPRIGERQSGVRAWVWLDPAQALVDLIDCDFRLVRAAGPSAPIYAPLSMFFENSAVIAPDA